MERRRHPRPCDLKHDPYELDNLVRYPSHAGVRETLREKLVARIDEVESERPAIESAPQEDPGYFDQRRVPASEVGQ